MEQNQLLTASLYQQQGSSLHVCPTSTVEFISPDGGGANAYNEHIRPASSTGAPMGIVRPDIRVDTSNDSNSSVSNSAVLGSLVEGGEGTAVGGAVAGPGSPQPGGARLRASSYALPGSPSHQTSGTVDQLRKELYKVCSI
jgi:hypothetical protein